jgi:hypothetical protein
MPLDRTIGDFWSAVSRNGGRKQRVCLAPQQQWIGAAGIAKSLSKPYAATPIRNVRVHFLLVFDMRRG